MDVPSPLLRPPLPLSRRILGGVVGLSFLLLAVLGYSAYRLLSLTPDATRVADTTTDVMLMPHDDAALPLLREDLEHRKVELVEKRLELLGLVADAYLAQHPKTRSVTMSELAAWKPRLTDVAPVEGESYEDLVFTRDWTSVAVTLVGGRVIEFSKPAPASS